MTIDEAITRAKKLEQYDFCYCAGKADFEAIQILADFALERVNSIPAHERWPNGAPT